MKTTRRRQTVAKKIKTAVVKNTFAAINVAQYGYEPTEIEVILEGYYFWFDEVEKQTSGQKSFLKTPADESGFTKEKGPEAIIHMTKKVFEKEFERLAALVFKAVNARDSGTIHDIANAIERLKRRTGASDIFRHRILVLKLAMDYAQKMVSLRDVAKIIKWKNTDNDGMSQLRRICRDMEFPLERVRQSKAKPKS